MNLDTEESDLDGIEGFLNGSILGLISWAVVLLVVVL